MEHLRAVLEQAEGPGLRLILTESVFSMDGDRADLETLHALARQYNAFLCVDERMPRVFWGHRARGLWPGGQIWSWALSARGWAVWGRL